MCLVATRCRQRSAGSASSIRLSRDHGQREESVMVNSKDSKTASDRIAVPLKAAVWFTVLGFIVLAIETPHWVMAPDMQSEAAPTSTAASTSAPAGTEYFPARFPAPKGEAEATPPTF
jgi:hypothetical protein